MRRVCLEIVAAERTSGALIPQPGQTVVARHGLPKKRLISPVFERGYPNVKDLRDAFLSY